MGDPMDIDSDFYGDDETITCLNTRVASFSPCTAPSFQSMIPSCAKQPPPPTLTGGNLYNPYAGEPYAWQLTETVDAFLARLPPSRTPRTPTNPWIYVCNPFIPASSSSSSLPPGCEAEAPLPSSSSDHVSTFIQGGMDRLHLLTSFVAHTQHRSGHPQTVIGREIGRERSQAADQILALARHLGVTAGKWMLFPSPGAVDEVWAVVARHTAGGELGIAAKVAPRDDGAAADARARERDRLVCVYTRDFADREDVARVLGRLTGLGLVNGGGGGGGGKPVYYKCDAFTYLGIGGGNTWGIKASMYSSTEVFAYMKDRDNGS